MAVDDPSTGASEPAPEDKDRFYEHVAELRAILVANVSLTVATSALTERLGREMEAIILQAGLDGSELAAMIGRVRETRLTLANAVEPVVNRWKPGK